MSKLKLLLLASAAALPLAPALAQTADQPPAESGGTIALPTVEVTATQGGAGGEGSGGLNDPTAYKKVDATTATKTKTPIMDTPVSIQVVPKQVLQDQQVVRLDKALENVSSVYTVPTGNGAGASGDFYLIRGFLADRIYRDGVLQPQSFGCCPISNELANVDHVEVLKGPASILYGRIEPGGLVNIVTKQPLAQPFYALEQQFGSFDFTRTSLDATGPIETGTPLFYRFNMSYENSGSFIDRAHNEQFLVSPVLRWEIDAATQVTFDMHYLNGFLPTIGGIPVIMEGPSLFLLPQVPRSRNFDPGFGTRFEDAVVGLHWSHAFNGDWTLRQRVSADFLNGDSLGIFALGPADTAGFALGNVALAHFRSAVFQTSADLVGHFTTLDLKHTLLLGADYLNEPQHNVQPPARNLVLFPGINIFTLARQGAWSALPFFESKSHDEWYGVYLQDQVEMPYGFHLLAGGRYDNARQDSSFTSVSSISKNTALNPRVGLLWRPVPEISLYGSYVQNFGLPNAPFNVRRPLPPETAQQWEAWVKTELAGEKLTATVAWFNLTKQNIATVAPDGTAAVTGEVLSCGLEMDVAGEILRAGR